MNEQALERMIGDLDRRIAIQLAEIQNHPELRELERVWRTLWCLVEKIDPDDRSKIALFPCRRAELAALGAPRPLRPSADAIKSSAIYPLFQALRAGDRQGLEPTAVVLADYGIESHEEGVELATHLSLVGMLLSAPIILTATDADVAADARFGDLRRKVTASFLCLTDLEEGMALLSRIAASFRRYGWGALVDEHADTRTRMLSDAPATPFEHDAACEPYYAGLLSMRLAGSRMAHYLRLVLFASLDVETASVEQHLALRNAAWSYLRRYGIRDSYTKLLQGFPEEILIHVNVDVDAEALRVIVLLEFNFIDSGFPMRAVTPTIVFPILLLVD